LTSCRRLWPATLLSLLLPLLSACVSLSADPRALVYETDGVKVQSLNCIAAMQTAAAFRPAPTAQPDLALDPDAIRIVTWNIHKETDAGWDDELAGLARRNDVLLLQEASLSAELQRVLHVAGLRWILASSFIRDETDIGVLTASRTVPVASCTQRADEPLARIPKSAVITWLRLAGTPRTLAVANVHAINFTLTLEAYRAQLDTLAGILALHTGPMVLGGDLNTWSEARLALLREIATRLELREVRFTDDRRSEFLGQRVDHVFVRGLEVVATRVTAVTTSDHNPVEVVLRTR
jgi:endonuclease/exonuclease/phosphatase (EEP) superfamily protein YafD